MTLQGSVVDGFIGWAKELIYERAAMKGLKFDPAHIMHVRDGGHDVVWLHHYTEKVVDEETGEEVEVERPVIFAEYHDCGLTSETRDDQQFILHSFNPEIKCMEPDLVIIRKPDGKILRREGTNQ